MVVPFLDIDKFDCLVNSSECEDFVVFYDTSSCAIVRMGSTWSVNKQIYFIIEMCFFQTLCSAESIDEQQKQKFHMLSVRK